MPDALPARVLIVRLSAIGDVLHGLPVLNALRDALPAAWLGWIVEGRTAELLQGHRALDEVIQVPRGWLKSPATVWRLRRRLRALRIEVAIDLQGLTKSALAAWLSGARRRIGPAGAEGRELSSWLNNERVEPRAAHVVDRYLELLRPLGIHPVQARFDLPEPAPAAVMAGQTLAGLGLNSGFAIINPGAGWPSKLWPPDRFAQLARHLGHRRGVPSLVVWAGPQEHAWADEIVRASAGQARLAPPTSLVELAALCRRARLFIGSDTGPLHLAAAVGTPCVGLFGPMPAARNGPYGAQHIALQQVLLTGSSRERRTANNESMQAIPVDQVAAACDTILARPLARARSA
jgi:lipopolysaccharide heptosyltransferase I